VKATSWSSSGWMTVYRSCSWPSKDVRISPKQRLVLIENEDDAGISGGAIGSALGYGGINEIVREAACPTPEPAALPCRTRPPFVMTPADEQA